MNKFIKLLCVLALSLCLILTFAACDDTDTESGDSDKQTSVSPTEDGGNGGNSGNGGTTASGNFNVEKDDDEKNGARLTLFRDKNHGSDSPKSGHSHFSIKKTASAISCSCFQQFFQEFSIFSRAAINSLFWFMICWTSLSCS